MSLAAGSARNIATVQPDWQAWSRCVKTSDVELLAA
jgi:hypothetical protein